MLPCDLVYVGEISKPHGIRGELSLHFLAESPDLLFGSVFIAPPAHSPTANVSAKAPQKARAKASQNAGIKASQQDIAGSTTSSLREEKPATVQGENQPHVESFQSVEIKKFRVHHGSVLISLEHVTDRTEAEKYRRYKVYIPRTKLPELSEDEYYIADMLNLPVTLSSDSTQQIIGKIVSIDSPAGQEIWTIKTDDGVEILFPAVPEFVEDIDLTEGLVTISPPPGLLDLYFTD